MTEAIRVTTLYRFASFADCAALRGPLWRTCNDAGVKGTLLLAPEGINGTVAGPAEGIDRILAHVRTLPGCGDLDVKDSWTKTMPFLRLKVRIKREIVTMGLPGIDPAAYAGQYVKAADWNALIDRSDTILIDTRNAYEVRIGSFAGAIDPGTRRFRDFPAWFRANRERLLGGAERPAVAMFCTGGIRCEKATAFLRSEGVDEVYHLEGGILKYLEDVPPEQSRWQGDCFVFDERVAVGHGLVIGDHHLCRACRMPVSPEDRASPLYVEGISCPACHAERSDAQRAGYAERHRQTLLAQARGEAHVGAAPSPLHKVVTETIP